MNLDKKLASVVELRNLYFDKISFWRSESPIEEEELKAAFGRDYRFSEDGASCTVTLKCLIRDREEEKLELELSIVGEFSCGEPDPKRRKALLTRNTLAILFPYLRSQVSIVTAQPNLASIILPPMNIDAVFGETE